MPEQELLRCAQYDQDNGPPDDLYVIPTAYAPSASPKAINNFLVFSRRLRTIRYPKDVKPAIEKYNGRSDPSICLKMYNISAYASSGNEDHMAGYFPLVMGKVLTVLTTRIRLSKPRVQEEYTKSFMHIFDTNKVSRVVLQFLWTCTHLGGKEPTCHTS
jgi:hypothetical protein